MPSLIDRLGRPQRGDWIAGVTNALVYLPQGIGYALLSGVNPIFGLYTGILPPIVGGLLSGSVLLHVVATNELAVPTGRIVSGLTGVVAMEHVFALTLLVGSFALAAGLLRLGGLVRFISNSVMRGFVSGIMVLLILSQLPNLLGVRGLPPGSDARRALEVLLHPGSIDGPTAAVGTATIVALVLLRRTPLRDLAYVVVMVGASAAVAGLGLPSVVRTGSQHSIRAGLPNFIWPAWSVLPSVLVPALSLTIIGLSFGAGVARDFPNPGGAPARPSRDFVGQGMANLVSAFFQCLPSAGSMSRTAYLVETGARTRWASVISGLSCLGLVATIADLAEQVPLTVVGGLLVVLGASAIDLDRLRLVWRVSWAERSVMMVTLVLSIAVSPQMAILLGVLLSLAEFVWESSKVEVTTLVADEAGRFREEFCPVRFEPGQPTALRVHGTAYFAAIEALGEVLEPAVRVAPTALVLSIADYAALGSTGVMFFQRFAQRMRSAGNAFFLVDVAPRVLEELRATGVLPAVGVDRVRLRSEDGADDGVAAALAAARAWLAGSTARPAWGSATPSAAL
ncbi:MAG: SulP family inorganic anion transporter [Myxococcaceae bacterium]|nr:MAG: SulP family inorganic anion transporter [Myxococcaceae bacterium]